MRYHSIAAFFFVAGMVSRAWAEDGKEQKPAAVVEAQKEKEAPKPAPPGPPIHPLNAYYGDGFNLSSEEGKFWLNVGLEARVQATVFDTNSVDDVRAPPPARFTLQPRSLHLFVRARIFTDLEFGLGLGLAGEPDRQQDLGQVTVAYAGYHLFDELQFQIGQVIVPFGLEMSSYFYPTRTIERSVAGENIAPFRDVGLIIWGKLFNSFYYHLSAISGTPPNINNNEAGTFSLFATDEQIDGVARLSFSANELTDGAFQGFKIGASFQIGVQPFLLSGARTLFLARSQPATLFDAATRGLRWRVGGDLSYTVGPFGIRGEGFYEVAERDRVFTPQGTVSPDGTVSGSDVLRFGAYAEIGVFVFGSLEEGGLEPVVKYEFFGAESEPMPAPINPVRLHAITGGLSYHFRSNVRLQLNGVFVDVRRFATIDDPDPAPLSYLDDRRSWLVQSQFQVWFL